MLHLFFKCDFFVITYPMKCTIYIYTFIYIMTFRRRYSWRLFFLFATIVICFLLLILLCHHWKKYSIINQAIWSSSSPSIEFWEAGSYLILCNWSHNPQPYSFTGSITECSSKVQTSLQQQWYMENIMEIFSFVWQCLLKHCLQMMMHLDW